VDNLEVIRRQIAFIAEVDKLKSVLRRSSPIGCERRENSAKHSWQVALSAIILCEHANESVDLMKVVKMLCIHDVVEIDVGDTFHYDKVGSADLFQREEAAARRIFGMLDDPLRSELLSLWHEFEARETAEARYAAAVDRLMAIIMNSNNNGGNWPASDITLEKIVLNNRHMADGARGLWEVAQMMAQECCEKGFIRER